MQRFGFLCLLLALAVRAFPVQNQIGPGQIDTAFVPPPLGSIDQIAILPDDKILVLAHSTSGLQRDSYLTRLNANGTADGSFLVPHFTGDVTGGSFFPIAASSIALASEGVLVGGNFTKINGSSVLGLIKLKADGSLDASFRTDTVFSGFNINTLAVQPDGRILAGGLFHTVNGKPMVHLARLNSDGTPDPTFQSVISQVGPSQVWGLLLESDNSIIAAGWFVMSNPYSSTYQGLVRLKSDGALNTNFVSSVGLISTPINVAFDEQRILLVSGSSPMLRRFQPDGRLDLTFNIRSEPNDQIRVALAQADGKILVGGNFTTFAGNPRKYIARLNSDGSLDETFDPSNGVNLFVNALALQSTNYVLVGGALGLVRLYGGDPAPTAPRILEPPRALAVVEGDNAVFRVKAGGFPLRFQWLKSGEAIAGATNSALILFNTTTSHAGSYAVVVSNALGQAPSISATLQILPRGPSTNLCLNSGFEEASNVPPPNSATFVGVTNWDGDFRTDLFQYPYRLPFNSDGTPRLPLQGSNYAGFASQFFSGNSAFSGALTGRLARPLQAGRYEIEGWFLRASSSQAPEVGIEMLLQTAQGNTLSLGQVAITNSADWQEFRRTLVSSNSYDRLVIRGAKAALQRNAFGYAYVDKLSLVRLTGINPSLAGISPQVIGPLQELVVANRVTNSPDITEGLAYSLSGDFPEGAFLDPASGLFHWTPQLSYAGTTNSATVTAAYQGSDGLESAAIIQIVVLEALQFRVGEVRLRAGDRGTVPLLLEAYISSDASLTNITFTLQFPATRLANFALNSLHEALRDCSLVQVDATSVRITCGAVSGGLRRGVQKLADLSFDTLPGQRSAFFKVEVSNAEAIKDDGGLVPISFSEGGSVGVVGVEPLLEGRVSAANFVIYGPVGKGYRVESTTNLANPSWQRLTDFILTNFSQKIPSVPANLPKLFLRVLETP